MADNIVIKNIPTYNISVSSLGTGETLITFVSGGKELLLKTIDGGGFIDVYTSTNNTIIVSGNALRSVSSLGGGVSLLQGVSSNSEILLRTISSSVDVIVLTSGNEIYFRTRNSQIQAVDGSVSEPIYYTIATAKSSAYLSVETTNITFGRAGGFGSNSYVYMNNITDPNARVPIPYNSRIIRVAGHITANATSTKTVSIFVNATEYTNILTFPVTTGSTYAFNMNTNIIVSAGQGLTTIIRGAGGNISNVTIHVWLKLQIPS